METLNNKDYWKGLDELARTPAFFQSLESEFPAGPEEIGALLEAASEANASTSRRRFLKAAGFSLIGSVAVACARSPVEKSIPLLIRPEEIVPGQSVWYAGTCGGCSAGCGILTANRDGRPIKIEGNPEHPLSKGGVCAVGQAQVLSLYDSFRLREPLALGTPVAWDEIDRQVARLVEQPDGPVYVLAGTLTSPSTRHQIERFLKRVPQGVLVEYDAVSSSAILDAHLATHGARILPHYHFDKAELIVSFDADFLGTWISPVEFTDAYTRGRTLEGDPPRLSHHVQFEGRMSLSGSNADRRVQSTPAEIRAAVALLARKLGLRAGMAASVTLDSDAGESEAEQSGLLDELASELWQKRTKSLVIAGANDTSLQTAVNFINVALGNYGRTVDIERPSRQKNGSDQSLQDFLGAVREGRVAGVLIVDANPVYDLPGGALLGEALKALPFTLAFTSHKDETAAVCRLVCPLPHALEAWNDSEVTSGVLSVAQPVWQAPGAVRSVRQAFATWSGETRPDPELMQNYWRQKIYSRQSGTATFQEFWEQSVHDGFAQFEPPRTPPPTYRPGTAVTVASGQPNAGTLALVCYEKAGMRDGRHAFNPWLHELPDPISKAVWDNYLCLSPDTAEKLGVEAGDLVRVEADFALELPVLLQPGQHDGVAAIAVGYGRQGTDRFSKIGPQWLESKLTVEPNATVGVNAFTLGRFAGGNLTFAEEVRLVPTGRNRRLALTQTHHTITDPDNLGGHKRDLVRETTLASYLVDPASGNHFEQKVLQLWEQDYVYQGHHWGLAIDLGRCTGCSACVVSCQAENNVPVVGRDEVLRRREMHWIRIDRYYSGAGGDVGVIHQPVMCHHCNHAPCESVCPVLATVHSDEGINQQIYNRCVGTRYCANNCPYKVRRFNWFDYRRERQMEDLALNPDITVRSRGVMEKCSLCVQRIQEAKAEAKRRGEPLADGAIRPACAQSCPAGAIVFGDMNDPESRLSRLIADPRHYRMLEEMNFRPNVGYLTRVRVKS